MRQIAATGGPVCCEVMTNVIYNLSRLALGLPSLTPTIIARMYDEPSGQFGLIARPRPVRTPALSWTTLAPLALPDLPEAIGRRLVEEVLLDRDRFWLPVAPPSVSASEPSFSLRGARRWWDRRYWRGPTWVNAAWMVWLGLVRLGYEEPAHVLVSQLAAAIAREGLREYYNPYTGAGMGATEFGWSSLAMELVEPDPDAARSYLPV
jgi:hypothetical protein